LMVRAKERNGSLLIPRGKKERPEEASPVKKKKRKKRTKPT